MSDKPLNKGGRPSFKPTDQQRKTVNAMAAYGIPQAEISAVIGCDRNTLMKHFRDELDTAAAQANAKVAESLFRRATGDGPSSVAAAIFWLKARAGWSEIRDQPMGKKESRQEKADQTASGPSKFAAPSAPKLIVNNGK